MITVVVNFPIPNSFTPDSYKKRMEETVPRYQNIRGLMRKIYIFNENSQTGGGIYNFENLEDAKACFNEEFQQRVTENFGKPDITYFDTLIEIDNLSKSVKVFDNE